MTRVKKGKPDADRSDKVSKARVIDTEIRWINPSPNSTDIEWLENNTLNALEDVIGVFESLQTGQRLTCKHDTRTDRWVVVLFDHASQQGDPTPALSVRGATAFDALLLLGYCVTRKYPDGWQEVGGVSLSRFG